MKNVTIYYVHGNVQSFTARSRYMLKAWLEDHHIQFQQAGYNFYVLDETGQRTGEVYTELNGVPTDDPVTLD